ncbi:hypothetical protein [Psychrobacter sp. DAB_AL32B]|uniref:hypothetical protein n=1 Tax=Psychrobacter sp. DAB_AL32B TaxID=1028414 RepID=UPI000B7EDF83|nr:hypothetical protein [Psychrobacter sp. DAB_AL32B]OXL24605.1 hypothetical protein CAN34_05485 [Psychrobacter sp. DAB_AL32B]
MQLAQSYLQGQASPFDGVLEAYGQGQIFRQNKDLLQTQQAEQARKIQAQQQLEQLDWDDMGAVSRVVAQFPEYTKGAQDYYKNMEAKEQQAMLFDMSASISALGSNRPDVAVQKIRDKANAYRDAGNEEKAEEYSQLAEWMATDPQTARKSLLMNYSALAGKDAGAAFKSYTDANITENESPYVIDGKVADTNKTNVEANEIEVLLPGNKAKLEAEEVDTLASAKQKIANAGESDARTNRIGQLLPSEIASMDAGTSLKTAQAGLAATQATDIPIARADAQAQQAVANDIAQLKLQLASEGNQVARERLQVQIDKLEHTKAAYAAGLTTKQIETNQKNQERLAQYESQKEGLAQSRSTITRLLNNKGAMYGLFGGGAVGPIAGKMPSIRAATKAFEKDIETLKSQVFLTQVEKMRGLGALTDFEGKKLESAIASLDLDMGEKEMIRNLTIIHDSTKLADERLNSKYKDLLGEVSKNATGSTAGRSYMKYAN